MTTFEQDVRSLATRAEGNRPDLLDERLARILALATEALELARKQAALVEELTARLAGLPQGRRAAIDPAGISRG